MVQEPLARPFCHLDDRGVEVALVLRRDCEHGQAMFRAFPVISEDLIAISNWDKIPRWKGAIGGHEILP